MKEKLNIRPTDYTPDVSLANQRLARVALGVFLRIATGGITIAGRKNIPEQSPFFTAVPHLGWLDAIAATYALSADHWIYWLTKAENFGTGLAPLIRFTGFIPVQRGTADRRAIRAVEHLTREGEKVIGIAPEGTRGRGEDVGRLNKAKTGLLWFATRLEAPVLPVAVSGADRFFPLIDEQAPSLAQLFETLVRDRPPIKVTILKSFTDHLRPEIKGPDGRVNRATLEDLTTNLMLEIAKYLPPQNRGFYAGKSPVDLFNR